MSHSSENDAAEEAITETKKTIPEASKKLTKKRVKKFRKKEKRKGLIYLSRIPTGNFQHFLIPLFL